VDQALVGYFPKLSLLARYTRLSPIDQVSLGRIVADTGPVPADPNTPSVVDPANLRSVNFSFPVLLNQTILQASLTVPLSDYVLRIPQAYTAASGNQRAAALTEKATRLRVAADSRTAYYTWVRSKLQEVVAEQALEQAKGHLVDARHAFDAGTISRADILRIESQVASSQLLLERATNFAAISEAEIRVAMHDDGNASYEVGEAVDGDPARATGENDNVAALWAEAKTRRLEAQALSESAESLRGQGKVARAGNLPRVDAFADAVYANPNQRVFPSINRFAATWDVGVQLTWSPNDIGASGASSRTFEARASSLVAQRAALEDGIRVEVMQAVNAVGEARAALVSTAQGLVAAEESYRVRRSLFQNGRATSVELTDAETDLTRARLEAINARVDLRIALVRREHATGRDVK
jgi:outer membrane protein